MCRALPVVGFLYGAKVRRAVAEVRGATGHGSVRVDVLAGIVAGLVSNLVLTLLRVVLAVGFYLLVLAIVGPLSLSFPRLTLGGTWVALKIAAYPFVGHRSLDAGFDARIVLLGLLTRLVFSISSGALFGLVAHGHSRTVTICLGVLCAIVYWAGSSYFITPPIGESVGRLIEFIPYGLALAITYLWYHRRCPRRVGAE